MAVNAIEKKMDILKTHESINFKTIIPFWKGKIYGL